MWFDGKQTKLIPFQAGQTEMHTKTHALDILPWTVLQTLKTPPCSRDLEKREVNELLFFFFFKRINEICPSSGNYDSLVNELNSYHPKPRFYLLLLLFFVYRAGA